RARVAAECARQPEREPVHSVRGERERGHVESRRAERVEPRETDEQVNAGEELHEAWHPHSPDPGGDVDRPAPLGEPEQLLSAVDQVARAEAEEADRNGDEGRRRERDGGRGQDVHSPAPSALVRLAAGVTSTTRCFVTGCSLSLLASAIPQRTFSSGI